MQTITINDYRREVSILSDLYEVNETETYKTQKIRVEAMRAIMMAQDNTNSFMAFEIIDEMEQLREAGVPFHSADVQSALWLLELGGYPKTAEDIRSWDWNK